MACGPVCKRVLRILWKRGSGYSGSAGNKNAAWTGCCASDRLSCLLEQCREKGYSGTAVFTKEAPVSVRYGIGIPVHDMEGRVITCEYPDFYFVTCYTPNSQEGLKRLAYRMTWEEDFLTYLKTLDAQNR